MLLSLLTSALDHGFKMGAVVFLTAGAILVILAHFRADVGNQFLEKEV